MKTESKGGGWVKAFLVMRVGSKDIDSGIPDRKHPSSLSVRMFALMNLL